MDDIPTELLAEGSSAYAYDGGGRMGNRGYERGGTYYDSSAPAYSPPVVVAKSPAADRWKPPFEVGQRVRHTKFGIGVVVACAPVAEDAEVTVAFPGVTGVKKLLQKFAKLEKA